MHAPWGLAVLTQLVLSHGFLIDSTRGPVGVCDFAGWGWAPSWGDSTVDDVFAVLAAELELGGYGPEGSCLNHANGPETFCGVCGGAR